MPDAELEAAVAKLASDISKRHRVTLAHAKIAAYTQMDLPFPQALQADESISHRMRYYMDPLDDVQSYLKSQKGGGNLDYRKPDAL